jgi:ankyrin repeat protein
MGCTNSTRRLNKVVSSDKFVFDPPNESDDCNSLPTLTSNSSFKFNDFLNAVKNDTISPEECENYLENEPEAIFAYDLNGDTAIHYAAMNRNMVLLRILVKFKVSCENDQTERSKSVDFKIQNQFSKSFSQQTVQRNNSNN